MIVPEVQSKSTVAGKVAIASRYDIQQDFMRLAHKKKWYGQFIIVKGSNICVEIVNCCTY
jgi:hypothetical protein